MVGVRASLPASAEIAPITLCRCVQGTIGGWAVIRGGVRTGTGGVRIRTGKVRGVCRGVEGRELWVATRRSRSPARVGPGGRLAVVGLVAVGLGLAGHAVVLGQVGRLVVAVGPVGRLVVVGRPVVALGPVGRLVEPGRWWWAAPRLRWCRL